jgi:hypothetical protein
MPPQHEADEVLGADPASCLHPLNMSQSRRLEVLGRHMAPAPAGAPEGLDRHLTAAQEAEQAQSYSVVLPEKLTESGPWLVRRWDAPPRVLVIGWAC